jgi:signal transduction histidine kinase
MTDSARASPTPAAEKDQGQLVDVMQAWMQATQRLQETHETLQREVVRLRVELASKDRELERRRRLACLGEIAAGVAHEVRNPLGAIRLYSGLLRGKCGDLAAAVELIEKIEAGISAIDGVVQDTLALAPRQGRGDCELREIVMGARDLAEDSIRARRVRLKIKFEAGDVRLHGDAPAMQRVLLNLIMNAADASSPGQTVTVSVSELGDDQVAVSVLDHGMGLSDETLERVFDPFFTTKATGTGLGLTIAHRLVETHGGQLTARNRARGGAEFRLVLPIIIEAEETTPAKLKTKKVNAA